MLSNCVLWINIMSDELLQILLVRKINYDFCLFFCIFDWGTYMHYALTSIVAND